MKLNPQIILLEKFEQFFIEEGNKVISTHPACQSCGKSVSPNQMKIFRFEYIPMNATRQMLKQLSHRQKLRMLVKKGNTFSLNHKDMFVVRIKNEYKNAKSQVLCISCFHAARHQFEWNILIDPSSSDKQLKEMIRNLIKKGANHEILEFCELMDPHISNRMRKIPRHVRHIWLLFSFFAKKLVLHPKAKPYVMQWMEKWLELLSENNFIASQIGTSIAKSIYAIDDEALCLAFFPILYQSDLNLFKFFRMNSEIHPNHSIILYLLQVQNDALFSDGQMDNSLQGLIAGCNTAQIKLLLENFDQFKESAQRILMEDLFFFGYRKNCADGLILLKAKINELPNPDLKAQFLTYFSELKTELSNSETQRTNALEEQARMVKLEQGRISVLHREWMKKKGPSPYQMSEIAPTLITKMYNPIIQQHIQTYRQEFEKFFRTHKKPVIAFDNEEFHNRVFCILAVVIYPDLTFLVKLIAVEDIYPINNSHRTLMAEMEAWLKSFSSSHVISHGTNQAEGQLIKEGGHFQINTQDILHAAKYFNPQYAHNLKGEGLKHFEKWIGFNRLACPMLKHEMSGPTFFNLAEVSLDQLLCKQPFSKCQMCQEDQDVLLYCLEDAFASLLIYVVFSNREPVLCQNLGYDLLR